MEMKVESRLLFLWKKKRREGRKTGYYNREAEQNKHGSTTQ